MIELTGITKTYGKGENLFTALDNIDLTIPDATVVAVVGKSGSGKSTMMHIMSGLDRPTTGVVTVNGRKLQDLSKKELDKFRAQEISFIFQSFFVQGNDSCYDNVSLPLEIAGLPRAERPGRIAAALESVELTDKTKQKAKNLSGGQKQRLAIARAIAGRPKILFADEPTGNLDTATGAIVEKLLFDYARDNKATLVIVTHDQDLAAKCDMQVHVKDGKITEVKQ